MSKRLKKKKKRCIVKVKCPNCGRLTKTGHFCPPSAGEEGFFACEMFEDGE